MVGSPAPEGAVISPEHSCGDSPCNTDDEGQFRREMMSERHVL